VKIAWLGFFGETGYSPGEISNYTSYGSAACAFSSHNRTRVAWQVDQRAAEQCRHEKGGALKFGSQFASADQMERCVAQLAAALSITNGLRRKEMSEGARLCRSNAGHGCTVAQRLPRAWSEHMAGTSQAAGEVAHDTGEAVGIGEEWMRRRREIDEIVDGVWEDGSRGMRCDARTQCSWKSTERGDGAEDLRR
jgi:hypothetical protein